ncbi:MAG TPA: hypothetical protein VLZ75_04945 [Chitinophagales bacterium]|nr:hypothetical protein [Chitinophagales bacterium]
MKIKDQIEKLAVEKSAPCVTISLNTHRTFPENAQDEIVLKNLLKEAEKRVVDEFGKRPVTSLLEKMSGIEKEINHNYNLDSLHIFLSNDTQEIIKSALPISKNKTHISETFAIKPLINDLVRSKDYLILLLSQGGVHLYNASNDTITEEVKNGDFPYEEIDLSVSDKIKLSDSKLMDDQVREYLNRVDKAVVKVYNETHLPIIVICTEDNYSRLMQVADIPKAYKGHAFVDYNHTSTDHLSKQAWAIMKDHQKIERTEAIEEMTEAVGKGTVLSDLQEIYQAALDGRGELLIVHEDFSQPVMMTSDRNFDLITDYTQPNAIDDITSNIAWLVLSKNGRVVFTQQDKIKDIGKIVLKTRY